MSRTVAGLAVAALAAGVLAVTGCHGQAAEHVRAKGAAVGLDHTELPPPATGEPDGEDDGAPTVPGPGLRALASAAAARFAALEPPPSTAHPEVCDVVGLGDALYVSHAVSMINRTGARVHRYQAAAAPGRRWSLAFDYESSGSRFWPDGIGGQGLPRLRLEGGRLVIVDGDPTPYGRFGISGAWLESYLYVSDPRGAIAAISDDGRAPAGTRSMPLAFHLFDVIGWRGAWVVSGGSMRVDGKPGFPGGVWIGAPDQTVFDRRYLVGFAQGVIRTTFMHRFGGRLYLGIQNNEAVARFDLAVWSGDPRDPAAPAPVLVRVTPEGGWLTRRFASGGGVLYWIAARHHAPHRATLFASTDGARFSPVALPPDAGEPQDMAVIGDRVVLLATGGLYRAPLGGGFARLAEAPPGDPFGHFDPFCSAPLVLAGDALYAGSTRDGGLYQIAPVP